MARSPRILYKGWRIYLLAEGRSAAHIINFGLNLFYSESLLQVKSTFPTDCLMAVNICFSV